MSEHQNDPFFGEEPSPAPQAQPPQPPQAKKNRTLRLVLSCVLSVAALVAVFFAGVGASSLFYDDGLKSLLWFKEQIDKTYYQDVPDDAFWNAAIQGVEDNVLDIYSQYYTAEEFDRTVSENQGIMGGFGMAFFSGSNKIARVSIGSPVFYASKTADFPIETGLYLTGIGKSEGELVSTFTYESMTKELSSYGAGETVFLRFTTTPVASEAELSAAQSTVVSVTSAEYTESYVLYAADSKAWTYLEREKVWQDVSEYVSLDEQVTGDVAVLRLVEFNGNAAAEFVYALQQFEKDAKQTLLLDLRNDGGGNLNILCNIAQYLMKDAPASNPVVLYAKYKSGMQINYSAGANLYNSYLSGKKVYVAANGNTASASEALMGAMIDYGTVSYADIFLTDTQGKGFARTYGKGIMQTSYSNPSTGEAVKLTSAQIFWPNGNSIHGKGVTTDDGAVAVSAVSYGEYPDAELTEILNRITA